MVLGIVVVEVVHSLGLTTRTLATTTRSPTQMTSPLPTLEMSQSISWPSGLPTIQASSRIYSFTLGSWGALGLLGIVVFSQMGSLDIVVEVLLASGAPYSHGRNNSRAITNDTPLRGPIC